MQVKKMPNEMLVTRILGKSSLELADKCPDRLAVFPSIPCSNIGCEYSIRESGYMNCTFVAAHAGGEHSLETVGEMMGISREGVRKIEVRAMEKLRVALEQQNQSHEDRSTVLQPHMATGPNRIESFDSVLEPENPSNQLRSRNGRELDECAG